MRDFPIDHMQQNLGGYENKFQEMFFLETFEGTLVELQECLKQMMENCMMKCGLLVIGTELGHLHMFLINVLGLLALILHM